MKTEQKPSAGAMRAAKKLYPGGVQTYCYGDIEQTKAAMERDWTAVALKVDEATALREMAEALLRVVRCIDYGKATTREEWLKTENLVRAALARHGKEQL